MFFAAAAAVMKPSAGTTHPSSSPLHAGSPAQQNTATAMGSLMAQLNPAQKSSLCKLQAGNKLYAKTMVVMIQNNIPFQKRIIKYDAW